MVSKVVRNNIHNLQKIAGTSPKHVKPILENAGKDLIEAIRQIVLNVLVGVIHLEPAQLEKLSKHKYKLRKISNKGTPNKERKQIIQTGSGFIIPLLTAVLPQIVGGIASLLTRKSTKNV